MHITYHIGRHDGGYAYRLEDVWSETFATHDAALNAARSAADRQEQAGQDTRISYELPDGTWINEYADGGDRPKADVADD